MTLRISVALKMLSKGGQGVSGAYSMQFKKMSIRNKLALATSALLLNAPAQVNAGLVHDSAFKEDDFSISGLYYSENDRIDVQKVQNKITKQLGEDHIVRVDLIYDTITGASPNGRIVPNASSGISTITSASGGVSTFAANSNVGRKSWLTELEDTRRAFNLDWEYKATGMVTTSLGVGMSDEDDYESYSSSGNIVLEFNQRRSTLNFGAAFSNDTVQGIVGIPDGLAPVTCPDINLLPSWIKASDCPAPFVLPRFSKSANKKVSDFLVGGTQVWNRRTIFQFNYARGIEGGYLTDPYKQISVVKLALDGTDFETAVLYEKRPRLRNTNSVFFKSVHVPVDYVAMNMSYRYFWDDWGIRSHTANGRLRINLGSYFYVQGHGRLHRQGAASFFYKQVTVGSDLYVDKPYYLSADSRLGELISATIGVKAGYAMSDRLGVSARVERMQQRYYGGTLPRLKAWIAQLIVNAKF